MSEERLSFPQCYFVAIGMPHLQPFHLYLNLQMYVKVFWVFCTKNLPWRRDPRSSWFRVTGSVSSVQPLMTKNPWPILNSQISGSKDNSSIKNIISYFYHILRQNRNPWVGFLWVCSNQPKIQGVSRLWDWIKLW